MYTDWSILLCHEKRQVQPLTIQPGIIEVMLHLNGLTYLSNLRTLKLSFNSANLNTSLPQSLLDLSPRGAIFQCEITPTRIITRASYRIPVQAMTIADLVYQLPPTLPSLPFALLLLRFASGEIIQDDFLKPGAIWEFDNTRFLHINV